MVKKTTLKKLQKNKCYCLRRDEDISLKECDINECHRWKACMKKTNNEIDKQMGVSNGKKI